MTNDFKPGDTDHEYYTGHNRPLTAEEADYWNQRFAEAHAAANRVYARPDVPALCEYITELEAEIERLRRESAALQKARRRQAMAVSEQWNMPDVVREYLNTGNESLRVEAWDAAWAAQWSPDMPMAAKPAIYVAVMACTRSCEARAALGEQDDG